MVKVQEDLASGAVIKGGCLSALTQVSRRRVHPPAAGQGANQFASGTAAPSPSWPLASHPLFLPPPLSSDLASFPSTVTLALPFWPTDSRMESISGFNPQCSPGCSLPGSVPLTWCDHLLSTSDLPVPGCWLSLLFKSGATR